jgi:hypothetical protein
MAATARQSGLAGSEAVACRTWLGQWPSTGGGRRADRSKRADMNEYVDEQTFLFRNGGVRGLGPASRDPPMERPDIRPLYNITAKK